MKKLLIVMILLGSVITTYGQNFQFKPNTKVNKDIKFEDGSSIITNADGTEYTPTKQETEISLQLNYDGSIGVYETGTDYYGFKQTGEVQKNPDNSYTIYSNKNKYETMEKVGVIEVDPTKLSFDEFLRIKIDKQ